MKITHCKLKKEVQKNRSVLLYRKLPPVLPPIFWVSIPIRRHCFTVKSARLSTIVWPWLPMRFRGPAGPGGSYFGVRRKGRRGRGAAGKAVVFGIPKRNGRAYTVAADNAEPETLLPAVKRKSCRTVLFMPIARAAAASRTRAVYPLPHQPFQGICRPSEPH
ncbi:IS1016 transposase [Neisseria gonorrhoeae]|uniref:IS1016 transposase n=1 Tax=Neisseria gonorrhoeae TaxID=485 RepID=A0A378VW33_NEIGO|nr:IS1016 transposase [Neisseria gonorrhoeae]